MTAIFGVEILLRFHIFKNFSNKSSLIANKIKIICCVVSIKLFIVRTILCATICNWMCAIIICLFDILLCSHPLSKQQHSFILSVQRRSSNHDCSLHTQCVFTQDWLNSYYSLSALFCLFICPRKRLMKVLEEEEL